MFVVDCDGSGVFDFGGVMMMMRRRASIGTMIIDDRGIGDMGSEKGKIAHLRLQVQVQVHIATPPSTQHHS